MCFTPEDPAQSFRIKGTQCSNFLHMTREGSLSLIRKRFSDVTFSNTKLVLSVLMALSVMKEIT